MSTENKTKPTNEAVSNYIAQITDPNRRQHIEKLVAIFTKATGTEPTMWGTSIIGYGTYHYKYASGREGDFLRVGLASRKGDISLYGLIWYDLLTENDTLLAKLGPHKTGKGCLYIKSLDGIDLTVLERMVANGFAFKNPAEV